MKVETPTNANPEENPAIPEEQIEAARAVFDTSTVQETIDTVLADFPQLAGDRNRIAGMIFDDYVYAAANSNDSKWYTTTPPDSVASDHIRGLLEVLADEAREAR